MKEEYDFTIGERGKHYKHFRKGTNLRCLEPDVAEVFKDSAAVNEALRTLIKAAKKHIHS